MLSLATIVMSSLALVSLHAVRVLKHFSVPRTFDPCQGFEEHCNTSVCKHTSGPEAAQVGVNIVKRLWNRSGHREGSIFRCRYATGQFRSDAEERLRVEFPFQCRDYGAFDASMIGRRAGENYINHHLGECFPVPFRVSSKGCGKYTVSSAAVRVGTNIVQRLWGWSGWSCSYATGQLSADVESVLLDEFPETCKDSGVSIVNNNARTAGENWLNFIKVNCSKVEPTTPSSTYFGYCGKYNTGKETAEEGKAIVHRLWQRNGENCRYAARRFSGDAESVLLDEFPDMCKKSGVSKANLEGRVAGENAVNSIIKDCSQPVPRPAPSTAGSNDDVGDEALKD